MRALLRRVVPVVRPRQQRSRLETKNGRYTFRYRTYDHKTGRATLVRETLPLGTSEEKARARLESTLARVNAVNTGKLMIAPVTFREFAAGYWAHYLGTKNVKPSTRSSYHSILENHILPAIGSKLLSQIAPGDITVLLAKLSEKSAKYRLNIYGLLDTMFALARQYDLIEQSPVRAKIHRPKVPRKRKPSLSIEQVQRTLQEVDAEYATLHWTVAITGIRLGELLGLQIRDLDLTLGRMRIERDVWRGEIDELKTDSSRASIHLPPILREMLRQHLERREFTAPDDFVFCRADGTPLDPDFLRNQVLYPAMDRAGIKREPRAHGYHIFRHTAGRIVYNDTRDLKAAQDLLRHARIGTTGDIYLDRSEDAAEEATEILAREISGKMGTEKIQ